MTQKKAQEIRVRIAPSPTGDPHVGTAYIALFNRTFAKSQGGKFILRIEDTDQVRSKKEYEEEIFDSLRWLGLTWDEGPDIGGSYGPYRQSERKELYLEHIKILIQKEKAYPCFCTTERLAKIRDRQYASGLKTGYDQKCRQIDVEEAQKKIKDGESHVIRLKVPNKGTTHFAGYLRKAVSWENEEIDDQVLLKSDGFPTYHLANVVDDHLMKITHVIRAEEWISSTPKHILLYEAFGWEPPVFCHMPLLRNKDTSKISKRKNPCSLHYYKKGGILPEALVNFLGLQGYSMPDESEFFSLEEFQKVFNLKRVKTRGPVFDLTKLYHINGLHLRQMEPSSLAKLTLEHLNFWIHKTAFLAQDRMESLSDYIPLMDFLFVKKADFHPSFDKVVPKKISLEDAIQMLKDFQTIYGECSWNQEEIEKTTKKYCTTSSLKQGGIYMTLRIAITGRLGTPPLMETMALLERFSIMERIEKSIEILENLDDKKKEK